MLEMDASEKEWLHMSAHIDRGMVGSEYTREVDVQASPKNARKENWAACDHADEQ